MSNVCAGHGALQHLLGALPEGLLRFGCVDFPEPHLDRYWFSLIIYLTY